MSASDACAACRFWDRYTDDGLLESERSVGDCRRHPPLISETVLSRFITLGESEAAEPLTIYTASAFPVTHQTSWCGEFDPINAEAPIC